MSGFFQVDKILVICHTVIETLYTYKKDKLLPIIPHTMIKKC
jgi:hypothetical protein